MKAKYAVSLLVLGYCMDFIGVLFKILHTAYADITLTIAAFLKIIGGLLFLYKLLTYPKLKDFFDQ